MRGLASIHLSEDLFLKVYRASITASATFGHSA